MNSELLKRKRGRPRRDEPPEFNINDALLIDEFKKRPLLYDRTHPQYRNREFTEPMWIEIAEALNMRVQALKDRMLQLRSRFSLERRRVESVQDQYTNDPVRSQWSLYDQMTFLVDHLKPRGQPSKSISLKQSPDTDSSDDETIAPATGTRQRNPPIRHGLYANSLSEITFSKPRIQNSATSVSALPNNISSSTINGLKVTNGIGGITSQGFNHKRACGENDFDVPPKVDKFKAFSVFMAQSLTEMNEPKALKLMKSFSAELFDALIKEAGRSSNDKLL